MDGKGPLYVLAGGPVVPASTNGTKGTAAGTRLAAVRFMLVLTVDDHHRERVRKSRGRCRERASCSGGRAGADDTGCPVERNEDDRVRADDLQCFCVRWTCVGKRHGAEPRAGCFEQGSLRAVDWISARAGHRKQGRSSRYRHH